MARLQSTLDIVSNAALTGAALAMTRVVLLAHWAIDALIAERRGTDRGRDGIRR